MRKTAKGIVVAVCATALLVLSGCASVHQNVRGRYQLAIAPYSIQPGATIVKIDTATGETWFCNVTGTYGEPNAWKKF